MVLKVEPALYSWGSGLHGEESEKRGRGECSGGELWWQYTLPRSPQGHVLLRLLQVLCSSSTRLPAEPGLPTDPSDVNAVIVRAVRSWRGRGEAYFKNPCQSKSPMLFFNSRLEMVVRALETKFIFISKVLLTRFIKMVFIATLFRQLGGREQSYCCSYKEGSVQESTHARVSFALKGF